MTADEIDDLVKEAYAAGWHAAMKWADETITHSIQLAVETTGTKPAKSRSFSYSEGLKYWTNPEETRHDG